MPLTKGQVQIGAVVIEAEPFEWFRSDWEVLELRVSRRTGWRYLDAAAAAALRAQYNGAHGTAEPGMKGIIVQYAEGTGGPAVAVSDWRGNAASCAYIPDSGLDIVEIEGTAEDPAGPFHEGIIRLAKVA